MSRVDLSGQVVAFLFKQGPLRAFASGQFRLLWVGSIVAIVSFFMALIARGWLILEMTDSPLLVTAINAVPMVPMTLFSIFGGVLADRLNRRLVLIVGDLGSGAVLFATAVLLFADVIQVWHVFAFALLHGAVFSIGMPARAAIVPDVVAPKDMASGVALYTTIFSAAQLAGPAPAGFLIEAFGMPLTFLIAAVLTVLAAGVLLPLRAPVHKPFSVGASRESVLDSILVGVRYTRASPILMGLMFLGLVFAFFGMPSFQSIMPVFARDVHNTGADGLGLMGAAMGAGALVGSVLVAAFSNMRQLRLLLICGCCSYGLFIVLFAVSPTFALALLLTGLVGFAMQLTMTSNFTVIQVIAPAHLRGRIVSLRMLVMGVGPLGMLLVGSMTEAVGPIAAMSIVGLAALAFSVVTILAVPALRRMQPSDSIGNGDSEVEKAVSFPKNA